MIRKSERRLFQALRTVCDVLQSQMVLDLLLPWFSLRESEKKIKYGTTHKLEECTEHRNGILHAEV